MQLESIGELSGLAPIWSQCGVHLEQCRCQVDIKWGGCGRIKEGRCPSLDCPLVKASYGKIFQAVSQPFPASDFDHMGKSSYMPAKLRRAESAVS